MPEETLRRIFLFLVIIAWAAPLFAAERKTLSLYSVIDAALVQDEEYNIVKQDRDSAVNKIEEALDTFIPTVRASATLNSVDKTRDGYKELPLYNVPSAKVRLHQVLFSDSKFAAMSTNENRAKAQRLVAEVLRSDIISAASGNYCDVIRYARLLRNAEAANKKIKENADRFKIKNPVYYDTKPPLRNLAESYTNLADMTAVKDITSYTLLPYVSVFGTDMTASLEQIFLTDKVDLKLLADRFAEKALAESPELLALDEFIKISRRDIVAAKRRFTIPDISVSGEYTRYFENSNVDPDFFKNFDENQWNMSLKLTIPIYDGSKNQSELAEKQTELMAYFKRKHQVREYVRDRIADSIDKAAAAAQSYKQADAEMIVLEQKYKKLPETRNYQEAYNLINIYKTSQDRLITAEHLMMSALVDVQRAYGRFFFYNANESDRRFMDKLMDELKISR